MNNFNGRKNTKGIGLIEVLITTIVIALGLSAIASLHGGLLSDSRDNKTRAEARALAESKSEELKDNINRTDYNKLAGNSDSPKGITEQFTRTWKVEPTTSPEFKKIDVDVCWSTGCPSTSGDAENQVRVQSIITFDDAGKGAKNLSDADKAGSVVGGPSTNAEASDQITETKDVADGAPDTLVDVNPDSNGYYWIRQNSRTKAIKASICSNVASPALSAFENGLMTRRINYDGKDGDEAIELYEMVTISNQNYCIGRIRFNGGVIIPLRGVVYSGIKSGTNYLDVNLFTFNASETGAYCYFNPKVGDKSAPYVCYVGGNCTGYTGTTNNNDPYSCPSGSYPANPKVGPGGWRGKVGLLGVAGTSSNFRNVCFAEEITSSPASLDTARNYYYLRNNINEGINKPFNCQNFLIIDGQSTNAKIHDDCKAIADAIGGFKLASKLQVRGPDTASSNIFYPTADNSNCVGSSGTSYTITGSITGATSAPNPVKILDSTQTITCTTVSSNSYTCNITTTEAAVTLTGLYDTQAVSCQLSGLTSANTSPAGCTLAFQSAPKYDVYGRITATTAASANSVAIEVVDGANTTVCTNNNNFNGDYSTYSCQFSTKSKTGVYLSATTLPGYSITEPTTKIYNLGTLSGSIGTTTTIGQPEDYKFKVLTVATYTISGNVTTNATSDVDAINTFTATIGTGNPCTVTQPNGGWNKLRDNNTGSYSCTLTKDTTTTLTLTINTTCSNRTSGKGANAVNDFRKLILSTSGINDSTNGSLTIPITSIQSNKVQNIQILESADNC